MGPGKIARAMSSNRQFVAIVLLLGLAVAFAPGSPGPSLVPGAGPSRVTSPGAEPPSTPAATQEAPQPPPLTQAEAAPTPPLPVPVPPGAIPSAPDRPLPEECATDSVADLLDETRQTAAELLAVSDLPGEPLRTNMDVAAGCSENPEADLTGALVTLALEVATLTDEFDFLDLDMDPIPLPDLRPLFIETFDLITPDVRQLLGQLLEPVAEPVRDACGNVAIIALLVAVFPEISPIPIEADGLQQFLIPVSFVCGLFDRNLED
jgi:hypothetical protein